MTAKKKIRTKKVLVEPERTNIEVEVEGAELPADIPLSTEAVEIDKTKEKPGWLKWLNSLYE